MSETAEEKFLAKRKKEQKEEIETLKQTREARSFAWMACYSITKPARLETNQRTGKPMLDIDWTEMTSELMRNLPLTVDEKRNCLSLGLTIRAPKMKIPPTTTQRSDSATPFTMQMGFTRAEDDELVRNFQKLAESLELSFLDAQSAARIKSGD